MSFQKPRIIDGIPKVFILSDGINIYNKINKLVKITEKRTFRRDKLITNSIRQTVDNSKGEFSVDNTKSLFSGIQWEFQPYIVYDEKNELIWDGIINAIDRDHNTKRAVIHSTDELFAFKDTKIEYVSSDWETPADAWRNICISIGFIHYNEKSVKDSSDQYIENNCYIRCIILSGDNVRFQAISEKLAEIGCADCFTHRNNVYYKHYIPFSGGVKVELTPKDLLKQPKIKYLNVINNYRIGYLGSGETPATDENSDNIGQYSRSKYNLKDLPEFSTSDGNQIIFKDKISATYIGNSHIKRTHIDIESSNPKRLQMFPITLPLSENYWIDINDGFFKLTYPDESWNEKVFQIMFSEIVPGGNKIDILVYEVDIL